VNTVLDLIEAFRRSQVLFAACQLGVFDAMPAAAPQLAERLQANADAMERLLDGCAALGLLRKHEGAYENTEVSERYLRSSSPDSLLGYIHYSREALYPMWGHLADAVREGTHRWTQTFGKEASLFHHFFRTDAAMRDFLMGMHGFGMQTSPKVAEAFDLARFRTLADLGGATGHLAIAACERYPGLRGVIFDLPRVTPLAREQAARSGAAERLEVVAGDFFEDPLPPADLYAVGRILHDWSEDRIARLLAKIYGALPDGGALLVAEKLLHEDGVGPAGANLQSLNMLICTEGKERSASQYTELLRAAGFAEIEARRTGVYLDAILAVKRTIEP